jgi:hypothetical protein
MQFTTQETKLIDRLHKQERNWARSRWIQVGVAVAILAVTGYTAHLLFGTLNSEVISPADSALLFVLFWPKVILGVGLAGVLIGLAIRDWHGNVQRMLLLRLLTAQQKDTNRPEALG